MKNSENTKRIKDQLSEQLIPKRWPLSNPNRTKIKMNTLKVKHYRNSETKKHATENHKRTTALERSEGLNMFNGANLALNFISDV